MPGARACPVRDWVAISILFGAGLALLLGVAHFLRPAARRNSVFGFLMLGVALLQFSAASAGTGAGLLLHNASKLLLAPLLWFFFRGLAGATPLARLHVVAHLLPGSTVALGAGWLAFGPAHGPVSPGQPGWLQLLSPVCTMWLAAYLVPAVFAFDRGAIAAAPMPHRIFGFAAGLVALVAATGSGVWFLVGIWRQSGENVGTPTVFFPGHVFGSCFLVVYVLLAERYPDLLQRIESQTRRYGKASSLARLDLAAVETNLTRLMTEERVYRNEELTLPRLAELADLTTHELSRFLNEHLGRNFAAFVNAYRIKEAQELLAGAEDPGTNLSVAMAVGFNSYTAFHTAFQKAVGMAPGKFRRARLADL